MAFSTSTLLAEGVRILHQKLRFVRNVYRAHEQEFKGKTYKSGQTVNINIPSKFIANSGSVVSSWQSAGESTVALTLQQHNVPVETSMIDRSLSITDVSERVLDPMMSVLAAKVESAALATVTPLVYNLVGTAGTTPSTYNVWGSARAKLADYLAPPDPSYIQCSPTAMNATADALKGLFQSASQIKEQYEEGVMGRGAGFDWYENTLLHTHTNSAGVVSGITVNGGSQTGAALTINTSTTAYAAGTVFTIAGVNRVHPETKADTGQLQQFVVGSGSTATSLNITPSITITGADQTVTGSPANGAALTVVGAASTGYVQHLAHHRDAFSFASVPLMVPKGVHDAGVVTFEGITLNYVEAFDVTNHRMLSRFDCVWGIAAPRREWACRVTG